MPSNRVLNPYLALVGAIVLWGLGFVAVKIAVETLKPFTLMFGRYLLASLVVCIWLTYKGFPRFGPRGKRKMLLAVILDPALFISLTTLGVRLTTASKTGLIIAALPLVVLVLAVLLLGERPRRLELAAIALSLLGIGVLVVGDPLFDWRLGGGTLGDLLVCGGVLAAAFYIIVVRNLGVDHSGSDITCMQILSGPVFFLPGFILELPYFTWQALNPRAVTALVYLAVLSTGCAYLCYNHAITRLAATRVALLMNASPVVTVIGAWLLLGERLTPLQASGGGMVLLAVFMSLGSDSGRAVAPLRLQHIGSAKKKGRPG